MSFNAISMNPHYGFGKQSTALTFDVKPVRTNRLSGLLPAWQRSPPRPVAAAVDLCNRGMCPIIVSHIGVGGLQGFKTGSRFVVDPFKSRALQTNAGGNGGRFQ
jgi:hypothetical protein